MRFARLPDITISLAISLLVLLVFWTRSIESRHWFVIPVLLCGVIINVDAVKWFRGKLNPMHPFGLIGVLGFHFFFLAPLLFVYWGHQMTGVSQPSDWRPWLGYMGLVNFAGLIAYRMGRGVPLVQRQPGTLWKIRFRRFFCIVSVLLVLGFSVHILVLSRFGGMAGYIAAYSAEGKSAFEGLGRLFMLSESAPLLLFMVFAIVARKKEWRISIPLLIAILLGFLLLQFLLGGMRGSRSNTVWALFWAVGIVHFWIRPLRKIHFLVGLMAMIGFLVTYSYYKSFGSRALQVISDPVERRSMERYGGQPLKGVLITDLSRTDLQAFVLYRLFGTSEPYDYGLGRSYIGALCLIVPRSLYPERPPTKVKEGTEVLYGAGTYRPQEFRTSRVFGLAGEVMLNFGPVAVPLAFLVFGCFVRAIADYIGTVDAGDGRRLLVPFLINLSVLPLFSDSDNLLFFLFKNGTIPVLAVYLSCNRRALPLRLSSSWK